MIAKADKPLNKAWDKGLTAKERSAIVYYTSIDEPTYNNWEQSYLKANYSKCKGWEANAWRVQCKDHVKAAIRAKWDEMADNSEMTVARVQAMYMEDREMAHVCKQPSAAISAVTGIARLYGMDKDNDQNRAEAPPPLTSEQLDQLREMSAGLAVTGPKLHNTA